MEMDFHSCLGVKGNSSEEDIITAYNHKVSIVESVANVDPDVRERKITELTEAKEKCLAWREAGFVEKGRQIVGSTERSLFSKSTTNACCGPFTLCCCGPTENTGMTWCCSKDCDSECGICLDVVFWLTISPGIFAYFKRRAEENRREAEAAARKRDEEARLQKQSEDSFRARYARFEPSPSIIRQAINDFEQNTYTNMFQEGEGKVPRDYAINTIREHTNSILGYYSECILNRSFDDAEECLRLLKHILASTTNAEKQLRDMKEFYRYSSFLPASPEGVWDGNIKDANIPNMRAFSKLLIQGDDINIAACIFALKEMKKHGNKEDVRKIADDMIGDIQRTSDSLTVARFGDVIQKHVGL